jgi:CheY-like chemotaxis protein
MAMLLTMSGNKCAMAHDGGSAIKLAEEFLPEVILLDIGLPEMDGYEVCEKIRQQPWGETVQIIAMTGWGQAEDRQRSKAAGINDHLVKPIEIAKLSRVMNGAQRDEPTNKESSY